MGTGSREENASIIKLERVRTQNRCLLLLNALRAETGNAREIKASAEFIALREKILKIIFTDEAGAHDE